MNATQFFGGQGAQPMAGSPNVTPQAPNVQIPSNNTPQAVTAADFFSGKASANAQPTQPQSPSVGGFINNVGSSAGNFVGNIGNAVMHPIQTVENLGGAVVGGAEEGLNAITGKNVQDANTQKWDAITNFYKQRYGSPEAFLQTLYKDPVGAAADASALLSGVGGAVGVAGDVADASKVADVGATIGKVGEALNPVSMAGNAIAGTAGKVLGSDFVGNVAKGGISQLTGLQPNDIQTIVDNPSEFTKSAIENYTRTDNAQTINDALQSRIDALKETGGGYSTIRSGEANIPVSSDYLNNLIKDKTGLNVAGDGTAEAPYELRATGESSIRNPSDVSALQKKILNTWSPEFAKGYLTPNEFLNLRSDLAGMAKYEGGIGSSGPLQNLSSIMRGQLNTDFRGQISGLAETDAKFAQQASQLNDLKAGILDKNNELKPTAVNKIATSLGKGKDDFLNQLEDISPGITKKIAIGKAIDNIQALKGNVVGTYGRAAGTATAAIAGLSGGPVGALGSALVEHFLTSPSTLVPFLRTVGRASPIYQAIMSHLNVATPAQALSQLGKISKASQAPAKRTIKVKTPSGYSTI